MKRITFVMMCAIFAAGCSSNQPTVQPTTQESYIQSRNDCLSQADKKLSLFDRPDTYPISDQEKHDARLSLFSQCMQAHDYQVAGPAKKSGAQTADLANLSPAAGGKPAQPNLPANIYSTPGGTVIVMQSGAGVTPNTQNISSLAALSPSSGGKPPAIPDTTYPAGATVVVVQGAAASAVSPPARPQTAYLPVAIPVPSSFSSSSSAVAAAAPASAPTVVAAATPPKPAVKPKPAQQASDPATQQLDRILTQ